LAVEVGELLQRLEDEVEDETDDTRVPIVSDPCPSMRPPTQSTATMATAPSNSTAGKKIELRYCA
jgi:hypothetical protein